MYVKVNGKMVYLWRAVDDEGEILESYVTTIARPIFLVERVRIGNLLQM